MLKKILVAAGVVALLVGAAIMPGGGRTTGPMTLYVDTVAGLDANPCTQAKPCKTLAAADALVPYRVMHPINFRVAGLAYAEALPASHAVSGSGAFFVNGQPIASYSPSDAGGVCYPVYQDAGVIAPCDAGACPVDAGAVRYLSFTGVGAQSLPLGVSVPNTPTAICVGGSCGATAPSCDAGVLVCTHWAAGICTTLVCQ